MHCIIVGDVVNNNISEETFIINDVLKEHVAIHYTVCSKKFNVYGFSSDAE